MSDTSSKIEKGGRPTVILDAAAYIIIKLFNPSNQGATKVIIAEGFFNKVPFQSIEGFLEIYKKQNAMDVLAFSVSYYTVY